MAALAPNTRKTYGSAWSGWQAWAADNGRPALPAASADVADYLEARHAAGAKVHQVSGLGDPTADGLCKDVLRRIGREGRDRGRGQVAGIGWAHAEAAASLASNGGAGLQGLRDAAIVRVMSDTLARISEVAALRCVDVEADATGEHGDYFAGSRPAPAAPQRSPGAIELLSDHTTELRCR